MNEINPPTIVRADVDALIRENSALISEINASHEDCEQSATETLAYARVCGQNLLDLKRKVGHGNFQPVVRQAFPFSVETSQVYMRVAGGWDKVVSAGARVRSLNDAKKLLSYQPEDGEEDISLTNAYRGTHLSSESHTGQSGESGEPESAPAEPDAPAAEPPPPPAPAANGTSGPKKNHPRCARCKRTGKVELCATCKGIAAALKQGPLCKRCLGDGPREDCPDCADLRGVQAEPETPRDALGLVVPDDKLPHFAAREKFQEAAALVRQLQKLLAEIAGAPGGEYLLGYMTLTEKAGRQAMHHDKLKALAHEIARQAPYCVLCPYCHAKAPGHPPAPECTACRGRPFVTEPIARGAPKDYLEAVKEMAR